MKSILYLFDVNHLDRENLSSALCTSHQRTLTTELLPMDVNTLPCKKTKHSLKSVGGIGDSRDTKLNMMEHDGTLKHCNHLVTISFFHILVTPLFVEYTVFIRSFTTYIYYIYIVLFYGFISLICFW